MRSVLTFILFFWLPVSMKAQQPVFCGEHLYDGEHKNEVSGYLQAGTNVITGKFLGPAVAYTRHFTDRISAEGAVDLPFGKGKHGYYAKGTYRLPVSFINFYFSAKFLYNRYVDYKVNEYNGNISATFETPYFDLTLGETLIRYNMLGSGYTEPPTLTFGTGVNIRPRWNSWNIGLFARNHDDFYFENWNINWGVRWNANLKKRLKLYGELNIRPAGSTSQLASRYESSLKVGLKYLW